MDNENPIIIKVYSKGSSEKEKDGVFLGVSITLNEYIIDISKITYFLKISWVDNENQDITSSFQLKTDKNRYEFWAQYRNNQDKNFDFKFNSLLELLYIFPNKDVLKIL